jgi:hypothetical protein
MDWLSAYRILRSSLRLHHLPEYDWIDSRKTSDMNGEDWNIDSSWSCGYLDPAIRE